MVTKENSGKLQLFEETVSLPETKFYARVYSLSPGFWQSFVRIGVHKDHIPALARFCKKQLTGFFVRLLFFVKCKHYH